MSFLCKMGYLQSLTGIASKQFLERGLQKDFHSIICLLIGAVALLAVYLVVGYATSLLVSVLGFAYPAYAS